MLSRIDSIEVIPIRMPNRVPIKLSTGILNHQDNVIVRVWSGKVCGVGETEPLAGFQGCDETHATIVPLIRNGYAPELLGKDPFDIARLVTLLDNVCSTMPYAKNGVVNALYDLMARLRSIPLAEFLGGALRTRLPVVWTVGIKSLDEMAAEAREMVGRGYRLLKIKIGGRSIEEDVENVSTVRRAVGEDIGIRVDANASLTYDDAVTLLEKLKWLRLELVEQPLHISDIDGMARLSALSLAPIMPDESLRSVASAEEMVAKRAVAIFGMKLAKHGGIFNGLAITKIAEKAGIPIYPGNQPSTSIGSANAAHFFAATKGATLGGDFHIGPAGWLADDIVKRPLVILDGFAHLPTGNGMGMELDEAKLSKYTREVA